MPPPDFTPSIPTSHPSHRPNVTSVSCTLAQPSLVSVSLLTLPCQHSPQSSNGLKDKNYMVISIDVEKAFDKIQHEFIIEVLREQDIPQHNKSYIRQTYSQQHLKWGETQRKPIKIRNELGLSTVFIPSQHSA